MSTTNNRKNSAQKAKNSKTQQTAKQNDTQQKTVQQNTQRVTIENKADTLKAKLLLTENVQFETELTAVNRENSATLLEKNAIMLTLVSDDSRTAKRVIEVWSHKTRNDVCISKRLFDELLRADEHDALQLYIASTLAKYQQFIDTRAKSSKYVFKLSSDTDTINFVNLVTVAL